MYSTLKYKARYFHNIFDHFKITLRPPQEKVVDLHKETKSVASIQNHASHLINKLISSKSKHVLLIQLDELVNYMKLNPLSRPQVCRENGIQILLKLKNRSRCKESVKLARIGLAMLGQVDHVKGPGIRILSLDGGGTRGVMTIEMLKHISKECQRPIHELFDLVAGTSTGAILAFLIAINNAPLDKCKQMYDRLGKEIFYSNRLMGAGKLFLNHAYYNSNVMEKIFKNELGEKRTLIETSQFKGPKVIAVSTAVNQTTLQPYLFRNYNLHPSVKRTYMGSSKYKLWQALRASTAAPGFFEEYSLDGIIHQDGGILTNNPCAVAIHEAKRLWPNVPIQTVVSIGTGVYHGRMAPHTSEFTSLREKLMKLVASATDVEATHTILEDLLPSTDYIRLNPNMSIDVSLDESRDEHLRQLEQDTRNYINKFSHKFDTVSLSLSKKKKFAAKFTEVIKKI